jgi:tetratricopeptide (TPR) repeat protein
MLLVEILYLYTGVVSNTQNSEKTHHFGQFLRENINNMFKVYAHFNNKAYVLKFDGQPLTSSEVSTKFVKVYNKKNKTATIDTTTTEISFDIPAKDLKNKCDIIATKTTTTATTTATTNTTKPTTEPPTIVTKVKMSSANVNKGAKNTKTTTTTTIKTNPALTAAYRPLLKAASTAYKKKQYKKAKSTYEQILNLDTSMPNPAALYGLAKVAAVNNKHAEVLAATYPDANHPPDLKDLKHFGMAKNDPPFLELLGDTLFALNHLRSAIRCYDECVQVDLQQNPSVSIAIQDQRKLKMAQVLYKGGEQGSAITVIQDVLSRGEDNPFGLLLYAQAAWDQGHLKAAIEVTMKGLVLDTENKQIRLQLATFVKGNCNFLLEIFSHVKSIDEGGDIKSAIGTAQALAFLATVIKDHGAIDECIQVYERVVELAPNSASYCLNLMHAYELQLKYDLCLERAYIYGLDNQWRNGEKDKKNDGDCIINPLLLSIVIEKSKDVVFRPKLKNCIQYPKQKTMNMNTFRKKDTSKNKKMFEMLHTEFQDDTIDEWAIHWEDGDNNGAIVVNGENQPVDNNESYYDSNTEKISFNKTSENDNNLDLMAIYFTVTKVLYITGKLKYIPYLVNSIEKVRRGQNLHQTSVRNEHAYYCCIAQLLSIPYNEINNSTSDSQEEKKAPSSSSSSSSIIVCGDSHSLTSAWRVCNNTCIQPLLVTGLKAWHLRDESNFYPKMNFYNAMKCLPSGSDVIMLFCEIDCREGILLAVEKDRYEDVNEGILTNVNIYVNTLLKIKKLKNINKLYVHPIPPVLDATRKMVVKFNGMLKNKVMNDRNLLWLDFDNDLIEMRQASMTLKKELELDGTHMSPTYLKYLESAWKKHQVV